MDSLQQNYNKPEPVPMAWYNTKTSTLYSGDLKISKQIEKINPVKVQFDPFIFQEILKENPEITSIKNSNQDWKIHVDFKDIADQEMKKFQDLALHLNEV